jgi:hypothetical protein
MGMFSWIKRKICKDPEPEKTDVATVVDGLVEKGFNRERAIATARYIIEKETPKRENREKVAEKAQTIHIEGEKDEDKTIDTDWLNRFFGIVEDVSDEDMQDIWARILAGENKHPSSYSLRTLDVLRNMSKEEAKLFVDCTKFLCLGDKLLIEDDYGLSLDEQLLLTDIGLISNEDLQNTITVNPKGTMNIVVNKNHLLVFTNPTNNKKEIKIKDRQLTRVGKELLNLIDETDYLKAVDVIVKKLKGAAFDPIKLHKINYWTSDVNFNYNTHPEKEY